MAQCFSTFIPWSHPRTLHGPLLCKVNSSIVMNKILDRNQKDVYGPMIQMIQSMRSCSHVPCQSRRNIWLRIVFCVMANQEAGQHKKQADHKDTSLVTYFSQLDSISQRLWSLPKQHYWLGIKHLKLKCVEEQFIDSCCSSQPTPFNSQDTCKHPTLSWDISGCCFLGVFGHHEPFSLLRASMTFSLGQEVERNRYGWRLWLVLRIAFSSSFLLFCFVFPGSVSLCSLCCPGTPNRSDWPQTPRYLPAFASHMLGLEVCTTATQPLPQLLIFILDSEYENGFLM